VIPFESDDAGDFNEGLRTRRRWELSPNASWNSDSSHPHHIWLPASLRPSPPIWRRIRACPL